MNYLDLFSGIGGFALGAKRAGLVFDNHFNSDIDDFCNGVYATHFPESVNLGDITKIDGVELRNNYGEEWIITGGFPCQDVSTTGLRKGIGDGTRSGLWSHYARLIGELKPKLCIIENVRGLLSLGFTRVLQDLANIGFDAEWKVIRACDVGLPHNRQRVWIVANPSGDGRTTTSELPAIPRDMGGLQQSDGSIDWVAIRAFGESAKAARSFRGQPLVYRRDYGLSKQLFELERRRVKALGNSLVPTIAEDIFRRWRSSQWAT